ncbi:uncharacterized protein [Elaeis guineensis]|uniref:Uncharacterized protein LOC105039508 n=1 Tax=Elaeis guineensis var. tenera TaxID=51953 RepID=A0A6I9QVK4_ELAGV|nr:uncharacterized protein LOC105039508 [Elaeis guineensis]
MGFASEQKTRARAHTKEGQDTFKPVRSRATLFQYSAIPTIHSRRARPSSHRQETHDFTDLSLQLVSISLPLELILGFILNRFLLGSAMLGSRGVVGDKWSQRILWFCAIGSAISLYMVAVERQAQNRERMMAEGLKGIDGASGQSGEDV